MSKSFHEKLLKHTKRSTAAYKQFGKTLNKLEKVIDAKEFRDLIGATVKPKQK